MKTQLESRARVRSVVLCLIFLAPGFAVPALAQYCIDYDPPAVFDTTNYGCSAQPEIDRSHFPGIITWDENEILVHSMGNELELLNINDPEEPAYVVQTYFTVGNQGDSDYDLQVWAMCDDCRYGLALYKLAAVIFDLGTGALPQLGTFEANYSLPGVVAGLTFAHGEDQYLVAEDIASSCTGSGLFKINGPAFDSLELLQCVSDNGGASLTLTGGQYLQHDSLNEGQPYLWASTGSYVHAFRIADSGSNLRLEYVKRFDNMRALASGTHQLGFQVDLSHRLAVSAFMTGITTWQVHDLENPTMAGQNPDVNVNILSLAYPVVWAARAPFSGSSMTFQIVGQGTLVPLDTDFWDEDLPWNNQPCLTSELGGAFTRDGYTLFVSRWEVMQRFNVAECIGPLFEDGFESGDVDAWSGSVR